MECHKLTAGENGIDCNRVDELCARQEEADTRILLYASHAASSGHDCIAIKSPIQMLRSLRARSVTEIMPICYSVSIRSNEGGTLTWPRRRTAARRCSVRMLTVRKQQRRHGESSVQTVVQQECANLQFAANQRCSQVPCRTSKLLGVYLAQFPGSGSSYAKSTWSWMGCD